MSSVSRISSSASPLSSRVNLELALCCPPAHHGQTQYGLPRTTDDGTLASHPLYPQQGCMSEGLQAEPLQEPNRYEYALVPAECQPPTQGCTYGDPPVQPLGSIQPEKYEQNLAPRTGLPQPYGCENLQLPLCTKSDQNTTVIIRHSALGMT